MSQGNAKHGKRGYFLCNRIGKTASFLANAELEGTVLTGDNQTGDGDGWSDYRDAEPFSLTAQGHDLTIFPHGKDRLDQLCDLISGARNSLKIFYYTFQQDSAGQRVLDAITDAARRGVDVCLMVDRFGTDAPDEFFDPIKENGGKYAVFSPKFSRRYLIRNHQKMCIIDHEIAMVGGFNVSDQYFAEPRDNGWCDIGVQMAGPVVNDLVKWFDQLSNYAEDSSSQYRAIRKLIKDWVPGNTKACLTLGGPTRSPSNWARMVKQDIAKGRRLDMVMAYFSPPRSFRRLLSKLAGRGSARLVMAGKSDNYTTVYASRATYGGLLRQGAKIYEFQPTKLHMKLIVIDDIVYFGSANFDHRSIRLNIELMFRFEDQGFADKMRELIGGMTEASLEVTPELHGRRLNLWTALKWWLGWTIVSTIDYTVARRLNFRD